MKMLKQMLSDLPFDAGEALAILATAPYRYKVYEIQKRNGSGTRVIAQPSSELKLLQRWIVKKIILTWPVHPAATAYRSKLSPATHAQRHAKERFLMKLDFENFFNSISSEDVKQHVLRHGQFSTEEVALLVSALTWKDKKARRNCVSVGAPSSPALTNSMMFEFDELVTRRCQALGLNYSRYADDLAFSTSIENQIHQAKNIVQDVLSELPYPKLRLNPRKTQSTSKQHRRALVGLILTPEGKVSLGRETKRHLRAALYRESRSELSPEDRSSLRGMLAYAWSVEPSFVRAMVQHYGAAVFEQLELPFN
jgi:hypothetical protein